jgi:tRNA dimethylallyltransferase
LVDIRDPAESYSAAEFCQDALREIQAIHEQGRIPLLVGGTMLYFKALLQGMADLPVSDPEIRSHLQEQSELLGLLSMHRRLEQVDPTAARRIHPNDPQRLLRALEVFEITGKPMTHFWDAQHSASGISLPFTPVSLCVEMDDRSELHERIAKRFRVMLELGFEEEVRRLYERGDLHKGLPSIRCVGYRQMWEYFDGDWRYDEMVERGIIATRQLAKRQMTWLRSWDRLNRFLSNDSKLVPNVLKLLDGYLI